MFFVKKKLLCAFVALGLVLSACSTGSDGKGGDSTSASGSGSPTVTSSGAPTSSGSTSPTAPSTTAAPNKKVHLSSLENDGTTWGVGMPIIIFAKPAPTDSTEFTKNVTVTVNGQPANGYWYWEKSGVQPGALEGHYRPEHYWPANAAIEAKFNLAGKSAGKGLEFDGKLTSISIKTGDLHRSVVNAEAKRMDVYDGANKVKTIPVSLGAATTPTYNGVKVVMQKGEADPKTGAPRKDGAVRMVGTGAHHYDEIVDWSVRVTNSGEYVHAAPWNSKIGLLSTSNGCTNLFTADAKWFYGFSQLGDIVEYVGTNGTKMPSWDGYGDWNVPWSTWKQGGELLNH